MQDFTFAVRHYGDIHPATREWFELQDRMVRKPCGSFALFVAGELPGDPEIERAMSLEEVFAWYQDCPEQIERTVFSPCSGIYRVQSAIRLSFAEKETPGASAAEP